MWRYRLLLPGFVVWPAACAQLAGLDETSGDGLESVSLAIERVSIGTTVVRAPQDLAANTATYLVPDAEPVPAVQVVVGTWSADLFEPTPVLFDLPDGGLRHWDYPNRALLGAFNVLEHPSATPVAPDSLLTVSVSLDTAYNGENLQLFTVGSWNSRGLEAPVLGAGTVAPPAFAMSTMTSLSGRDFERITLDDDVFVLRSVGNTLNGVAEIPPFDQTGNDTLTGAVTTVALGNTLDIRIDPTGAASRLSAARPAVPAVAFAWNLRAAPGFDVGDNNGPLLNAAGVGQAETMVQTSYANPFVDKGWAAMLTWSASASRTFTLASPALPVTLNAGMFQLDKDPTAGLVLDLPAGLPELITLDGRSLSTDGMTIAAPAAPLVVTFITDRPAATLYQVQLIELAPNADGTAIVKSVVVTASAVEPTFSLPPELFVAGKTYTLRALTTQGGFPNIASGDLRTRSLPIAVSFLDSGVFTVMP